MPTTILGLAHNLPPTRSVGSVERPVAEAAVGPSDLAVAPARQALSQAGIGVEDVEFIAFATMTPDVTFPGAGCYFQHKLGCGTVGALDIRGQCAGFLMALVAAESFMQAGTYKHILLAAAEVHSSMLDYSARGERVAMLYGDGAAVAMLGARGAAVGPSAVVCHSDGSYYDRFWCQHPSSRQHPLRVTVEDLRAGRHFPSLDFELVKEFGIERLPEVVREVMVAGGGVADSVDCFILSHILPEVVEQSARSLGIPSSKLLDAGALHGHLTAAALPVALSEAIEAGRLGKGARVCLATCGAGFAWGAALLTL